MKRFEVSGWLHGSILRCDVVLVASSESLLATSLANIL